MTYEERLQDIAMMFAKKWYEEHYTAFLETLVWDDLSEHEQDLRVKEMEGLAKECLKEIEIALTSFYNAECNHEEFFISKFMTDNGYIK